MGRVIFAEQLDRRGAVAHRVRVERFPFTVGRAYRCDLVVDDPHVAAEQLVVDETPEGVVTVQDAGLPGHTATLAAAGELLIPIGRTRLRLRDRDFAVAPALPLVSRRPFLEWLFEHWSAPIALFAPSGPAGARVDPAVQLAQDQLRRAAHHRALHAARRRRVVRRLGAGDALPAPAQPLPGARGRRGPGDDRVAARRRGDPGGPLRGGEYRGDPVDRSPHHRRARRGAPLRPPARGGRRQPPHARADRRARRRAAARHPDAAAAEASPTG